MVLGEEGIEVVRRFCETVSARNIQNLEILRAIDRTVDWLTELQDSVSADTKFVTKFIELIKTSDFDREIDPDEIVSGKLEGAENALNRAISLLKRKQQAAISDEALVGEHKQCVVDEYEKTISEYTTLQETIAELRGVIKSHDAGLMEVIGPFDTAESLIASLKA